MKAKETKNIGRPTKKTETIVEKLIESFENDATISEACYEAGIDRKTYYRWLEDDKEFSNKMEYAQTYMQRLAIKKLKHDIFNPEKDPKYAIEYLKRRDKRYSDKQENKQEHDGKIEIVLFDK